MQLKGLSNVSDEYFMVMANDRVYHDKVELLIDHNYDYPSMMRGMESICSSMRVKSQVKSRKVRPNRISIYLHMAATMDKLNNVHHSIKEYAYRHDYISADDPPISKRYERLEDLEHKPEPQEVPMKFKLETITYIGDDDVEKMSKDSLFGCVNTANERKESLLQMEITSKAVDKELNELDAFIVDVVNIIDRRFG